VARVFWIIRCREIICYLSSVPLPLKYRVHIEFTKFSFDNDRDQNLSLIKSEAIFVRLWNLISSGPMKGWLVIIRDATFWLFFLSSRKI
jgi:hypothetical protein